jgi:hypothetical protein
MVKIVRDRCCPDASVHVCAVVEENPDEREMIEIRLGHRVVAASMLRLSVAI